MTKCFTNRLPFKIRDKPCVCGTLLSFRITEPVSNCCSHNPSPLESSNFTLLVFWSWLRMLEITDVHQCGKVDVLFLSLVLPEWPLSCFSLSPRWQLFELLPCFVHCGFRIRNVHRLRHRNKFMYQIIVTYRSEPSALWSSWLLGKVDSKRLLAGSWASTMNACFVLLLDSVTPLAAISCNSFQCFFVPILQGMAVFFFCFFFCDRWITKDQHIQWVDCEKMQKEAASDKGPLAHLPDRWRKCLSIFQRCQTLDFHFTILASPSS